MSKFVRSMLAAAVFAAGCSSVREAREAQRELAEKGGDAATAATGKFCLKGAGLADLVDFALTNRPSVVTASLAVDDARLALRELAADAPVLSDSPWTAATLSASGGHSESSAGITHTGNGDWRTSGNPSAGLSLSLLVYDFGRYDARAAAQAEKVVAAELAYAQAGLDVFNEVSEAYFNFLEQQALLAVALTNESMYAEHLAQTEARLKYGESYKLDLLKARLNLDQARQLVVSASNEVRTCGAKLTTALGIDVARGTWLDVVGDVGRESDRVRRGFRRTCEKVEDLFALARTNSPSMRVKRAQLRAASKAVDYAVADLMPSVSVSASLSWVNPYWYWSWGVEATESLFQGFRKTTAVRRATVAMRSAATAIDESEQELSVSLESAVASRDDSLAGVRSSLSAARSARENLLLVCEKYACGEANRIEMSDAIAADSQAAADVVSAFYAGQRAEARLIALCGKRLEYRESIIASKELGKDDRQ